MLEEAKVVGQWWGFSLGWAFFLLTMLRSAAGLQHVPLMAAGGSRTGVSTQPSVSRCTRQARTHQVHCCIVRLPPSRMSAVLTAALLLSGAPPLVAVGRVSGCINLLDGYTGQPRGEVSPASSSDEGDESDR